jgi:hypothetical protein
VTVKLTTNYEFARCLGNWWLWSSYSLLGGFFRSTKYTFKIYIYIIQIVHAQVDFCCRQVRNLGAPRPANISDKSWICVLIEKKLIRTWRTQVSGENVLFPQLATYNRRLAWHSMRTHQFIYTRIYTRQEAISTVGPGSNIAANSLPSRLGPGLRALERSSGLKFGYWFRTTARTELCAQVQSCDFITPLLSYKSSFFSSFKTSAAPPTSQRGDLIALACWLLTIKICVLCSTIAWRDLRSSRSRSRRIKNHRPSAFWLLGSLLPWNKDH